MVGFYHHHLMHRQHHHRQPPLQHPTFEGQSKVSPKQHNTKQTQLHRVIAMVRYPQFVQQPLDQHHIQRIDHGPVYHHQIHHLAIFHWIQFHLQFMQIIRIGKIQQPHIGRRLLQVQSVIFICFRICKNSIEFTISSFFFLRIFFFGLAASAVSPTHSADSPVYATHHLTSQAYSTATPTQSDLYQMPSSNNSPPPFYASTAAPATHQVTQYLRIKKEKFKNVVSFHFRLRFIIQRHHLHRIKSMEIC